MEIEDAIGRKKVTVDEAIERKKELEDGIRALIRAFEKETKLSVHSIEVITTHSCAGDASFVNFVNVDVRLGV